MRTVFKTALMALLFTALGAQGAAAYYFGGLDDYAAGVPSQEEKLPFEASGREAFYSGVIADIEPEERSVLVVSSVPGFFGPELVGLPVEIGDTGTVAVCFTDTGECEVAGTEGWTTLISLPERSLIDAEIIVMGYPEDESRIITITTARRP